MTQYVCQPEGVPRLGDYLHSHLEQTHWTSFRAAIAFVKRSGMVHIRQALEEFSRRSAITMTVGVDLQGTSEEGLRDLLQAIGSRGQVWVYHNEIHSTFHPKVYVFKSESQADILVGSGNLTEGGLFSNYEASLAVALDLSAESDRLLLKDIEDSLDLWSNRAKGTSVLLTADVLERLVADGYVAVEARARETEEGVPDRAEGLERPRGVPLFARVPVRGAPPMPREAAARHKEPVQQPAVPEPSAPLGGPARKLRGFVMTLQRTDVGVGQTTAGTSRRSPEIFVPLAARDHAPDFWGWPQEFADDPSNPGKKDRHGVKMRLGTAIVDVNMMTWPVRHDFRLRSEHIRSAGDVGDVLRIEKADGKRGFSYYVEVIPEGTTLYGRFLAQCVNSVRSRNSRKRWGYY